SARSPAGLYAVTGRASAGSTSKSVTDQSLLLFIDRFGDLYSGVDTCRCGPWRIASFHLISPHCETKRPAFRSIDSSHPLENCRSKYPRRSALASVARVRTAAEFTV